MTIDAALYSGSKCYFFDGARYIRVTRGDTGAGTVDAGYPKAISTWGWPAGFGSTGIDAALYSGSKCYFFDGSRYIRVTRGDTGPGTVDPGYPNDIATWGWPAGFGGTPFEIDYSWTECIYAGRAAFRQRDQQITVRIQLNPDADVTAQEMTDLRTRWEDGIENKWSNHFACCTRPDCSERANLVFQVVWTSSNPHHQVRVRRGPARSNQVTWDTEDTGDVASHEFGHMLGHPDEYADAACPARNPVNTGTVMADNTEVVQRLCEPFCTRLGQTTSTA
jgi:Hemopexin